MGDVGDFAVNTLTEATALFGVGAGIYLLASAQGAKKAHH